LITWVSHYQYFSRIGTVLQAVPGGLWPLWFARLQQTHADQKAGRPGVTLKQILGEQMLTNQRLLEELSLTARQQMIEALDLNQCVAEYRLVAPMAEIKAVLDGKPDFEVGPAETMSGYADPLSYYVWIRKGESEQIDPQVPKVEKGTEDERTANVVGSLRLYSERLIAEVYSKKRYAVARQIFERYFGDRLQFERETIINMGERLFQRDRVWSDTIESNQPEAPEVTPGEGAPSLAAQRETIWSEHREHYNKLLADPVPELKGLTPRAAAQDSNVRPDLIEWLKKHLHHLDSINRQHGLDLDIDWCLDELQVPELK
jgi:hypothetical protein